MSKFSTRTLAGIALLTALEIILSRFLSISMWNTKIGFSFLPIAVAAILFGPLAAGTVGALGDFIGAILFPIGAYFPGFTLTAFLTGLVFGFFLHREQGWLQVIAAIGINQLILSLLLNTLWISILYGSVFRRPPSLSLFSLSAYRPPQRRSHATERRPLSHDSSGSHHIY